METTAIFFSLQRPLLKVYLAAHGCSGRRNKLKLWREERERRKKEGEKERVKERERERERDRQRGNKRKRSNALKKTFDLPVAFMRPTTIVVVGKKVDIWGVTYSFILRITSLMNSFMRLLAREDNIRGRGKHLRCCVQFEVGEKRDTA